MSLREINTRIRNINQSLDQRKKRLAQLEAQDDPESIIEAARVKNELALLEVEKTNLSEEASRLRRQLEVKLPDVESQYFKACEDQKRLLKKLYEVTSIFLESIEQIKVSIDNTRKKFMGYRNVAMELEQTPKSIHLEGLYNMNERIITQIKTFSEWLKERLER